MSGMINRTAAAIVAFMMFAAPAAAQVRGWDGTGLHVTRAELEQLLARYEATASSASGSLREQARQEVISIRQRLEEGDLRVGDRVLLVVEGHPQLTDTFNVVAGRKLVLPDMGDIPLEGVLRSELPDHLTTEIGRFIRNPTVRARSLVRLEILGAVGRPGYYAIPSDVLVSDALMIAGGPAGNANVEQIKIQRGRDVLWEGDRLRTAVIEGRTLDQLSVRAGDGIFVPQQGSSLVKFRTVIGVVSGIGSIVWLMRRIGAI